MHTGEKKFSCEICSRKFRLNSYLKAHMRGVHSLGKSMKKTCPVCCKLVHIDGFTPVKNHMFVVFAPRNLVEVTSYQFTLDVCTQTKDLIYAAFVRRHDNNHTRVHLKEMPYECSRRSKAFCKSDNLNRHLKSHENKI
ncbi:putative zinc finger protein [Orchesella cincta]|uniref:Putative zinc finger protein n=1 Tax=Orchesella cincta TaxID=48709 RepID=A0A1D2MED8_ORCCI|nr:putative zinc finger protein [Orchesella cincta]